MPTGKKGEVKPLVESSELIDILMVAYQSLCERDLSTVADGTLRDLIRQLKCFGLTLLPLDCRNESIRHSEALDAITRYLGIGSYLSWDEPTRQAWLLKELHEKRPLLPHCKSTGGYSSLGSMFDETVCDVLGTFDVIAEIPEESLGACTYQPLLITGLKNGIFFHPLWQLELDSFTVPAGIFSCLLANLV